MTDPVERQFVANGLTLAAREWGQGEHLQVLALHGWLDNCASFDALARRMPKANIVAPDLAGHGQSSHRSKDSAYNIWQDLDELLQIVDSLGWSRFVLMGHSRGAMIATLLAAVAPERISHLVLIEGLVPVPLPAESAPEQLARAIRDKHKFADKTRRYFPTLADAAKQRTRGDFPLDIDSAMCLALRGTQRDENGFFWSADPRLQGASEVKFSAEQLRAFVRAIEAPVQLFLTEDSLEASERLFGAFWTEVRTGNVQVLPGSHHLHMQEASHTIAEMIDAFLVTP